MRTVRPVAGLLLWPVFGAFAVAAGARALGPKLPAPTAKACTNDTGLTLPPGFCATVFADHLGFARHMAVAANGVVYLNTWSGVYFNNAPPPPGGFLVALQDSTGNGRANVIQRFGRTAAEGARGGVGIALYRNALYRCRHMTEICQRGSAYPHGCCAGARERL